MYQSIYSGILFIYLCISLKIFSSEYIVRIIFVLLNVVSFICTEWGSYDLLVLPPSFPYGGMENPCLTFVTPTLLAGDKSLVGVIAHEIAHSWTGNLVTNATWDEFWVRNIFIWIYNCFIG